MMTRTAKTTNFGLLRHGQTEWNLQHRIQGSADSPLTSAGKAQTEQWAKFLQTYPWHRLLVSDQGRARQTAAILNSTLKLPLEYDSRLREQRWGKWEGLTIEQLKVHFGETLRQEVAKGWNFRAPGGESRTEVKTRVENCLLAAQNTWQDENILIVCHQGVIKCLLYSLTGREFVPGEDPLLQHNSLHLVSCTNNKLSPKQLNISFQTGTLA